MKKLTVKEFLMSNNVDLKDPNKSYQLNQKFLNIFLLGIKETASDNENIDKLVIALSNLLAIDTADLFNYYISNGQLENTSFAR